jgi:TRAP-type C4-dicarboxylate transport system substrate-binding protein
MFARTLIPIAAVAIALGGCLGGSGRDSRTGAQRPREPAATLVLAASIGHPDPALEAYADEVALRSGGTLELELRMGAHSGDPATERKLLADVKDGRYPLGIMGARVLDTAGVRSFQALLAPGLVTSLELENAIVNGDIGDQMLAGIKPAGVTGIGLVPGPLRRMLGVTRHYRTAEDFAGARVGMQESDETAATLRALGATPVPLPYAADISGVDGYEQQLESAAGNGYGPSLQSITSNLVLWPRPLVVVANPAALAELSDRQREALTGAIPAVRTAYANATAAEEREGVEQLCRSGITFVRFATPSFTEAVRPVYDYIERDPATKRFIEQIRAMDVPADPVPRCSATQVAQTRKAGALDGVYRMSVSEQRQAKVDGGDPIEENWGDWRLVIDRGRFVWTQDNPKACTWGYGTATLEGDLLVWDFEDGGGIAPNNANNKAGEHFVWKPKLYRDTLSLQNIEPDPEGFGTVRWTRTSDEPSRDAFFARCEPPPEADVG